MATTRNRIVTTRNHLAVRNFAQKIEEAMISTCRSSIKQAAKIGLQEMVNGAGFNDYTGKTVNSYQAAIITKGGIEERIGKAKKISADEHGINASGKSPILMTSYGMPGTIQISHSDRTRKGFKIRNRRDGGESTDIRKGHTVNGLLEKSYGKGHGQYFTRIKGVKPRISKGYWLVFDNGAFNVKNKGSNVSVGEEIVKRGSVQHNIFPQGVDINLMRISQAELKRVLSRYKRHK